MNSQAFYQGVMQEIHKQAADISINGQPAQPEKKKSSWLPTVGAIGAGALAGGLGYHYLPQLKGMMGGSAPAATPPPANTPLADFLTQGAKDQPSGSGIGNVAKYLMANPGHAAGTFGKAVVNSQIDANRDAFSNIKTDPGNAASMGAIDAGMASVPAAGYSWMGRFGAPAASTVGAVGKGLSRYGFGAGTGVGNVVGAAFNKDNSAGVRAVQGAGGLADVAVNTPLAGRALARIAPGLAAKALASAAPGVATAGGAEALGTALGPAGWIGTGAGVAGQMELAHASGNAAAHADKLGNFDNLMLNLHNMLKSGDPAQVNDAVRSWQVLHNNPYYAKEIKGVTNPGYFTRLGYSPSFHGMLGGGAHGPELAPTQHLYNDVANMVQQNSQ